MWNVNRVFRTCNVNQLFQWLKVWSFPAASMSGEKPPKRKGGDEQSDGPEVPKFAARNRIAEKKRRELVGVVMQSSKECYNFSKSKERALDEVLHDLVTKWDDLCAKGSHTGDEGAAWLKSLQRQGRDDIDDKISELITSATNANKDNWLDDEEDALGVLGDRPLLVEALHELWALWAEARLSCSKTHALVPCSWPRLVAPVEVSDESDESHGSQDEKGRKRVLRKSLATPRAEISPGTAEVGSERDVTPNTRRGGAGGRVSTKGLQDAVNEAQKAELSLRKLAAKIDQQDEQIRREKKDSKEKKSKKWDKKGKKSDRKKKSSRKPAGSDPSDSDGSNSSEYAPSSSGSGDVPKKDKKQKRGKHSQHKKRKSRKHGGSSPSSSDGSDDSENKSTSGSSSGSSVREARKRARRGVRSIRTQQVINMLNAGELVAAATTVQKQTAAKVFSWSALEGRESNTLVQYCTMVYQGNGRALPRAKKFIEEHRAQGVNHVDAYLLACSAIDTMILEDQPKNLWSCAVGELLARYAYGFERALENFRGPANDKMKPEWDYFDAHRVDEVQTKLVQADKEMDKVTKKKSKK